MQNSAATRDAPHRRALIIGTVCAGIFASSIFSSIAAQAIIIAPTAIVIDSKTRTATVTLINTGDKPSEVKITTKYGYPVTDSLGYMRMEMPDALPDNAPSAAEWIRSYPSQLILQPGARRTVRLLASPPDSVTSGEWWSRLIVEARESGSAKPSIELLESSSQETSIGLNLVIRTVVGVFYRNSDVNTGIAIEEPRTEVYPDSLVVRAKIMKSGNAAFIGVLNAVLHDENGIELASGQLPLGIYSQIDPRIPIEVKGLVKGEYSITVSAESVRPDIPSRFLIPISPVSATSKVVIGAKER